MHDKSLKFCGFIVSKVQALVQFKHKTPRVNGIFKCVFKQAGKCKLQHFKLVKFTCKVVSEYFS